MTAPSTIPFVCPLHSALDLPDLLVCRQALPFPRQDLPVVGALWPAGADGPPGFMALLACPPARSCPREMVLAALMLLLVLTGLSLRPSQPDAKTVADVRDEKKVRT
jgi:hypothetical protein